MNTATQGLLGAMIMLSFAWLISENRRGVSWRTVGSALALFIVLGLVALKFPPARLIFSSLNDALIAVQRATTDGTMFVFGFLGGGPAPFPTTGPGSTFVLAFQALPLILVVSALSALLFYWRILPLVVNAAAWVLMKTIGLGGAVGVSTAANVFLGMVEAPLLIRPYLARLSRGELFMVMTCGMASTAGTVMALYAAAIGKIVPDALGHILIASVISAPAGIALAALMVPSDQSVTEGGLLEPSPAGNSMDAISRGTIDGVQLTINVAAMLLVLSALVSLANQGLALFTWPDGSTVTMQSAFGILFAPLAWLTGVPWAESQTAGALLGTKTVLNEFVAYLEMAKLPPEALSLNSRLVMTYALCGFANFAGLGIMIGGMVMMIPERRLEILELGWKSIISGTLATCLCGALVATTL
jgi:concentrative nucleoside transporter, CNT family